MRELLTDLDLVDDADVLRSLSHDEAEWAPFGAAVAAVRPKTTEDVRRIVAACAQQGAPIVPRGAGTGLSGGANAVDGAVIIEFCDICRIDLVHADSQEPLQLFPLKCSMKTHDDISTYVHRLCISPLLQDPDSESKEVKLVEPNDDLRVSNPPVNGPLLDELAKRFADSNFDLRALIRTIMTSRLYQLSSDPGGTNIDDDTHFSHAQIQPLEAEQLLDALSQVTGTPLKFNGYPVGMRAVQLPAPQTGRRGERRSDQAEKFLKTFGKPERLPPVRKRKR